MSFPILLQTRWKAITICEGLVLTLILAVAGIAGIYIMFYIENLEWGGRSFFGAVFIVPPVLLVVSKLMKIDFGILADVSAPAGCLMLAVMKVLCLVSRCCGGRIIYRDVEGVAHYFPSQIVELCVALVITVILLIMSYKPKYHNTGYAWFLILYGVTRFLLNWFRRIAPPFIWILPAANVWSIVAIAIGLSWLVIKRRKDRLQEKENIFDSLCIEKKVTD